MRPWCFALIPLLASASVPPAAAAGSSVGLPTDAFALTWAALPTGRLSPQSPNPAPVQVHAGHATAPDEARMTRLLDDAFASAADAGTRREIALDEMMTSWDQPHRSSLQRLRDAEVAYAGGDEARRDRFAALLARVVDGTGRSAARDGSASKALDGAYAGALSRQDDQARAATEAAETAFVGYRDAFAAFADTRAAGTGAAVADELDRQRATDLDAGRR